jgi:hypothetical protein
MKVAIIGDKKNTKSLAMEIAIKCNIPIVVKPFYCYEEIDEKLPRCNKQCIVCRSASRKMQ